MIAVAARHRPPAFAIPDCRWLLLPRPAVACYARRLFRCSMLIDAAAGASMRSFLMLTMATVTPVATASRSMRRLITAPRADFGEFSPAD